MKCIRENVILRGIFSSTFFMLYRGILDYFLDSVYADREVDSETAGRLADGLYKIN